MKNVDSKNVIYIILAVLTVLGIFANLAKTYYLIPAELQHTVKELEDIKNDAEIQYAEFKLICKELDDKVDGIDHAITVNNKDVYYFTTQLGELKGLVRELQKE